MIRCWICKSSIQNLNQQWRIHLSIHRQCQHLVVHLFIKKNHFLLQHLTQKLKVFILSFDIFQEFDVNDEVRKILENLKGPIGVIAVAGQYRTGKSYLLNRMLLNRQKGFGVGPTINPCTKGLWVWGTPVQGQTKDGQPINVLVVDSEGIGGLDEDNNHDMRIFSLAMLLSSYFLYNSVGSIDENALQSLSLVTNLTKHIQFKSKQNGHDEEEEDLDSLTDLMPSFMWVVRDFALQLCDEQGSPINSQGYLEKALQEKGGTDQKNEIRKHLKMFFRDRECCTMIRPLTNEDELQNLERLELTELRSEFVEQIMQLRKKVLGRMKPKTVNGQALDAQTWLQMVAQYVKAINEGCVPNIQSSWAYICRQNAGKTVEACKTEFEKEIFDQVQMPINQDDLDQLLLQTKQQLVSKMTRTLKADPDIVAEFVTEFTLFADSKSAELVRQNHEECRQYASDLLTQLFTEFDQQIKSQQHFDLQHLELTLKELTQVYDQNSIDFAEKPFLLSEAKAAFLQDTLFYLSRKAEQDHDLQRQLDGQAKERLELQLKETKDELRGERGKLEDKLRQAQTEQSESQAVLQVLREQYEAMKASKELDEREFQEKMQKIKSQSQNEVEDYRGQKEEFEEKLQEMQRHLVQVESEFDKERALFEQKVDFLEKSIQEKSLKEREFLAERQSQKQGLSSEIRTLQQKYENDIKILQTSLEEEKEKLIELETQLKERQQRLENREEQWNTQETQYKMQLNQASEMVRQMEMTVSAVKKENESKLNLHAKEKEGRAEQYTTQIQELESQYKDAQEQLKQKDHENKKERAIKDQKLQFLEMQLQDCKDQLEEAHKQHDHMVKAMKHHGEDNDGKKNKLSPSKLDALQQDLIKQEEAHQLETKDLRSQLEHVHEKLNEAELQLKLTQADYERESKDLKYQLQETEQTRQQATDKMKVLEQQRIKLIEDSDKQYKEAVSHFEEEMEEKTSLHTHELKEMQEKSEESLAQLRNFYEIEKEKLEQRVAEEREKGGRRLQTYQEDLEQRMRGDLDEKDEEIECLQNELREIEQRHQANMTQLEHELNLKHHLLETLERQVKEARDRIETLEYGKNSAFERQIDHFEQQRQEYNQKIDKLQSENLEKDRLVAQMQHKMERLQEEMDRKRSEMDQIQTTLDKDKKQVAEKLESTKKKLSEMQDEAMKQKLEFGREQALSKQQIEFQNKKIEELQKQCDDSQRFYDDKISKSFTFNGLIECFKAEIQDEAQSSVDRITSEKELWENKYEQKRRALKEIEMSLSKSNNELEKKIAMLQAQVERLDEEKRQADELYQEEIQSLNQQIQALDSSAGAAYYYGSAHAEDVLKYKAQLSDLERELSDLQSTYDRDKALWEGKCQFLETQKETYKRDLLESQKKFEITLEQLQKRGNLDKDKFENSQNSLMKVMEARYKSQIKELMDTHQCFQVENQQKIKRLESELKQKNEQIQMDARGKLSEYGSLEKKVIELSENEKRLSMELDEVKKERERRIQDYQKQMDKDKETYRQKLSEYEQKAKESESRRASLMFEYEKDRAKWQLEKDNLNNLKVELSEQVEKLQLRKDQLLRENEKLRAENKGSRKYLLSNVSNNLPPTSQSTTSSMSSHHGSSSATRYMVGKSLSGAIGSTLGQAITKLKENTTNKQYIGSGKSPQAHQDDSSHTTPITKPYNRYGGPQH